MQNLETNELESFSSQEEMDSKREENPKKYGASFYVGEEIKVTNSLGQTANFRIKNIGKRFMMIGVKI